MTAASVYPPGSDQGLSEGRVSEPSMEDILASIRRIIADDQQANGSRAGARRPQAASGTGSVAEAAPAPAVTGREEVIDLAHYVSAHDAAGEHQVSMDQVAGDGAAPVETGHEMAADQVEHEGHGAAHDAFEIPEPYAAGEDPQGVSLLAPPMSESVMSAFEALAATVVLENKPLLEGILRDLLRPMLKAWLDDNLPSLVERLVRVEIERVARGGRS